MKTTKFSEIRDMSVRELDNLLDETRKTLFRLRFQARMERLDSPSELKKNKRLIAQILTLKSQRAKAEKEAQQNTKN